MIIDRAAFATNFLHAIFIYTSSIATYKRFSLSIGDLHFNWHGFYELVTVFIIYLAWWLVGNLLHLLWFTWYNAFEWIESSITHQLSWSKNPYIRILKSKHIFRIIFVACKQTLLTNSLSLKVVFHIHDKLDIIFLDIFTPLEMIIKNIPLLSKKIFHVQAYNELTHESFLACIRFKWFKFCILIEMIIPL